MSSLQLHRLLPATFGKGNYFLAKYLNLTSAHVKYKNEGTCHYESKQPSLKAPHSKPAQDFLVFRKRSRFKDQVRMI